MAISIFLSSKYLFCSFDTIELIFHTILLLNFKYLLVFSLKVAN